jgi:hypothetical protein
MMAETKIELGRFLRSFLRSFLIISFENLYLVPIQARVKRYPEFEKHRYNVKQKLNSLVTSCDKARRGGDDNTDTTTMENHFD